MITYRAGSLFLATTQALAHGCNTQGVMGAGIALQFKSRYPEMFQEYRELCLKGRFTPGGWFGWTAPDGKVILNLATQDFPGPRARPIWIEQALLGALGSLPAIRSLAIPRIGTGLGGLGWGPVQEVLERVISQTGISLVVYTL